MLSASMLLSRHSTSAVKSSLAPVLVKPEKLAAGPATPNVVTCRRQVKNTEPKEKEGRHLL